MRASLQYAVHLLRDQLAALRADLALLAQDHPSPDGVGVWQNRVHRLADEIADLARALSRLEEEPDDAQPEAEPPDSWAPVSRTGLRQSISSQWVFLAMPDGTTLSLPVNKVPTVQNIVFEHSGWQLKLCDGVYFARAIPSTKVA